MINYFKKQKKYTRSIYLNTANAYYVDDERRTFSFKINPVNIEDESLLYVKNTNIDYNVSGLSVKEVKTSVLLRDTGTSYAITYASRPDITFIPQDGKGTGASGVAIMGAVGLTTALYATSTALAVVNGGSGYTGSPTENTTTFTSPITGGQGASVLPTISTSTTGVITTPISVSGSSTGAVSGSPNEHYLFFPYSGTGTTRDYTFTTTEPIYGSVLVVGGG